MYYREEMCAVVLSKYEEENSKLKYSIHPLLALFFIILEILVAIVTTPKCLELVV